jgi:hypothetical protein
MFRNPFLYFIKVFGHRIAYKLADRDSFLSPNIPLRLYRRNFCEIVAVIKGLVAATLLLKATSYKAMNLFSWSKRYVKRIEHHTIAMNASFYLSSSWKLQLENNHLPRGLIKPCKAQGFFISIRLLILCNILFSYALYIQSPSSPRRQPGKGFPS